MQLKTHDDDLVMGLVEMAMASPGPDRERYLQDACAGDAALLELVRGYVEWERRLDGFLSEPLYPRRFLQHPFEPGQLLQGRFRIIREVAQGGMGIVYEALDEKLDRRIALKCAKSGFHKRLPPEVRNASDISHPNVCKTFEIHTAVTDHGELDFLTMEFLDGETLADRLRRGPLTEKEASTIALQLCAGLAEAHHKHVIHGDLKSNNVILARDGDCFRAVITDFGLARRPDSTTRALRSSQMAGTPDCMAPELWKGAKPSIASDIYALGIILRELLPGRHWSRIVRRCLHPDPAGRFQSAEEVANAIAPRSRRWFIASAAAALLAVVSGVVSYQTATAPKETVRLAMLPFASAPEGLSRDIANQLNGLKSSRQTKFSFGPNRTATHVLNGTMDNKDGRIFVRAYLTEARSQTAVKEWKADYAPAETRYIPTALAGMVTGAFHLPALTKEAAVNAAARQDYQSGLIYMRRDTGTDAAIVAMQKAVNADPDSPLTHAGSAEAWWWKYFLTKDSKYLTFSEESLRQAVRRNADLAAVHRVSGLLQTNAGFFESAIGEYLRAIELEPGNSDGHRRLGLAYQYNNQMDQAIDEYRRALELDPAYYRNYQAMGSYYKQRSEFREAAKYLEKAVQLAPEQPAIHFALGATYLDLGRLDVAAKELNSSVILGETPQALHSLGLIRMYQGEDQDAVTYIRRALNRWPQQYLWWLNLGIAYRRLRLIGESEQANRRGLAFAEAELVKNPRNSVLRAGVAYLCARLGDSRRAESELAQALHYARGDSDTGWMAINTFEALGKRNDSLDLLRTSPAFVIADISRFPDLADLASDPRFLEIWNLKRDEIKEK